VSTKVKEKKGVNRKHRTRMRDKVAVVGRWPQCGQEHRVGRKKGVEGASSGKTKTVYRRKKTNGRGERNGQISPLPPIDIRLEGYFRGRGEEHSARTKGEGRKKGSKEGGKKGVHEEKKKGFM